MNRLCPVYALMPLRVLGLTTGGIIIVITCVAIFDTFIGISSVATLAIGYGLAVALDKASKDYPGGYLQYKASNFLTTTRLLKVPVLGEIIAVGGKGATTAWVEAGSLPPPSINNHYYI